VVDDLRSAQCVVGVPRGHPSARAQLLQQSDILAVARRADGKVVTLGEPFEVGSRAMVEEAR